MPGKSMKVACSEEDHIHFSVPSICKSITWHLISHQVLKSEKYMQLLIVIPSNSFIFPLSLLIIKAKLTILLNEIFHLRVEEHKSNGNSVRLMPLQPSGMSENLFKSKGKDSVIIWMNKSQNSIALIN